ncbi:MAG: peptidoglycan DD-metalloendopeptidase family protein [Firmicutes bacterium]|nr:peptidoglycan DD-metalloendopeptidase family protein [Bacillota bacterium]
MRKKEKVKIALKVMLLAMAVVLAASPLLSPLGFGSDVQDKQDEYNNTVNNIKQTEKKISEGEKKANELTAEIKVLEKQIYDAQVEINILTVDLNATKEKIKTALAELEDLQNKMDAQNAALLGRIRTMYKQGDVGLISVLLGSANMTELITNIEMMKMIYQSDADLLEKLGGQYAVVEEKKNELVALRTDLEDQQAVLNEKKSALDRDMSAVENKKKQIEKDNAALEAQLDAMNKEADALKAEIIRLQSSGSYIGGAMGWPSRSSTRITDPFGMRLHPFYNIYKLHTGIDIGARNGSDILAAADGTVIAASHSGGYGYYIMIDHGGGIVTLYAHSSKLIAKKGDKVKRGETIALVGSTGMSTGPHIHFEVRVNGSYKDPLQYVTPGRY